MFPDCPSMLHIEINNTCNLHCAMCPRNTLTRSKQTMGMDVYQQIIDEAADLGIPRVRLFLFGEPLLHPNLIEMINYAKEKGIECVDFNSNGVLINEKTTSQLLSTDLDLITFSVTGADQEVFSQFQGHNTHITLETVEGNIKYFISQRNSLGKKKPEVKMQFIATNDNRKQVADYYTKWNGIADCIKFTKLNTYKGMYGDYLKGELMECPEIKTKLVILANGEVTVCCPDYNGELAIGNIRKNTIFDLWNHNPKMLELRRCLKEKDFARIPFCKDCDVFFTRSLDKDILCKVEYLLQRLKAHPSKVVLFGANTIAKEILEEPAIYDQVVCLADNSKYGQVIYGKDVYAPDKLDQLDFDLVFITSPKYAAEIYQQIKYLEDQGKVILSLNECQG